MSRVHGFRFVNGTFWQQIRNFPRTCTVFMTHQGCTLAYLPESLARSQSSAHFFFFFAGPPSKDLAIATASNASTTARAAATSESSESSESSDSSDDEDEVDSVDEDEVDGSVSGVAVLDVVVDGVAEPDEEEEPDDEVEGSSGGSEDDDMMKLCRI